MPTFKITAGGKAYKITAPDQATAIAAFQKYSGGQSAPTAPTAPQYPTDAQGQILGNAGTMAQSQGPLDPGLSLDGTANQLSAGFTSGVNALPIVGPSALGGLESLKGMVQGRPQADVAATDKAQADANPIASGVGTVAGTVLPFMLAGGIPGVGRVLGMSGGLPSRIGFGIASGSAIGAADTAARGGDTEAIKNAALLGGAAGGGLPLIERGAGLLLNKTFGVPAASQAAKNVFRAMRDDNINPATVDAQLANVGTDARIMDLGPNLQRQAGAVASVPGAGQTTVRDAVAARSAGASDRVTNDVAQTIGTGPDLDTLKAQVAADQKAAADPLYDKVRDVVVQPTGNLKFVLQTPAGKKAYAQALVMAKNDGYGYQAGNTVGLLDYMKQALDDQAAMAGRTGGRNAARGPANLARLLRTEIDKQVPGYKTARDAFAGHAAVADAIDEGTTIFTKDMSPTQLATRLTAASPSEKDALLQGGRSWVESQMGNAVNDALSLRNLFKRSANEQKLRLLLGDNIANDLLARINREAAFGRTANVVSGNSETAARQAAQAEVAPELRGVPKLSATWTGIVLSAFDKARQALHGVRQPAVNAQMADYLTSDMLTPDMLKQLRLAARTQRPALIAPALPGLMLNGRDNFTYPPGTNAQQAIGAR